MLTLSVREFNLSFLSGVGWSGTVQLNVEVHDQDRKLVYPSVVAVGRASLGGSGNDFLAGARALNTAYANALKDIDWDRIAFFLKRADFAGSRKEQAGDRSRQYGARIDRHPMVCRFDAQGCRCLDPHRSSTPEVKNTNQNYVVPRLRDTETFDVKGLTFNNSGNVQIEVVCEKPGYIAQKKRFNLRQAIEQKEISTKFNLVKEE